MTKRYQRKDWLEQKYCKESLDKVEIADTCGVSRSTVDYWMDKHGVERKYKEPDWLREKYWEEELSAGEMAEMCGVDRTTILYWMDCHGIERRGFSESSELMWRENEELRGEQRKRSERVFAQNPPPVVADGCHLEKTKEKISESLTGESNPRWRGGTSDYYGGRWDAKRAKAILADSEQCSSCGMPRAEHRKEYGRDLHVHHKIPVRVFDDVSDAHFEVNLVTVCVECHKKFDRISREWQERKMEVPA
jgi:5-methylcytosine-specific restriction endonuclease McrA/predicted DNA-binding protein YlxM (UPF0122 family)